MHACMHRFFSSNSKSDELKISLLRTLNGVGASVASTILTLYDPKNYGVFDKHVWRELFGKEPENLYTTANCLKVLAKLREIAKEYDLDVRTVEKAYFKRNLERES